MLASDLQAEIEGMSAHEFSDLWDGLEDDRTRCAVLYARCRSDKRLFARTFFPERFGLNWSPVQEHFLSTGLPPWRERASQTKRRWVAPRGSAKSSIKSFLEPLHDILYGREVCIHVYSTGYRLAEMLVKDLHAILVEPPALLAAVYGHPQISGTQTNFVARVSGGEPLGTAVVAMSFGGDARGYKHAGKRPSKFILDDTVNPKHLKNPDKREEQWAFLQKDIGRAGWSYSCVELVGTIQHPDDLVARLLKAPDWSGEVWKNLISWPKNMALWEKCREIWANLTNPARLEEAANFYQTHKAELQEGAQVLWPEGRSLWELMMTFWGSPGAFWSEDQNQPRGAGAAIFDLERARKCKVDLASGTVITSRGITIRLTDCRTAIWLDPSSGKERADYPALALVARWHPAHASGSPANGPGGLSLVLSVEMMRRQPSAQQAAIWSLWERVANLRPKVGVDETGAQALIGESFARQREERRRSGKAYQMPIQGYTLHQNKEDRISSLEPDVHNGWIEFADDLPGEFWEQLRDFPNGAFDDGIDAVERALWLLTGSIPHVDSYTRG